MSLRRALISAFNHPLSRRILGYDAVPVIYPEEPLNLSTKKLGGFYAPAPGDVIDSRYKIIRKLGWGAHSNVWLGQDSQGSYASLKILSAHATAVQQNLSYELKLLEKVKAIQDTSDHPGCSHILTMLEHFRLSSKHGEHLCIVTEVLGDSFVPSPSQAGTGPVKSVTRQLLHALDFLHTECQVIHTDIKHPNILFALPNVKDALAHDHSKPRSWTSSSPPPQELSRPITTTFSQHVKLIDFSAAASFQGYHSDRIQPDELRAPEVIIGLPWASSVDVWNLGCIIFELLTGKWLFALSPPTEHLSQMTSLLGETFHRDVFRSGQFYKMYFREDGSLRASVPGVEDMTSRLRSYEIFSEDELPLVSSFLLSMLRLDPTKRLTARELLDHDWLKSSA